MNKRGRATGFTIVELLIVIVVIAILAAISLVSYNGLQIRASNSAMISAARNTVALIKAYKATYGNYPSLGSICLTTDNTCMNYNGVPITSDNTYWMNELRKIGTPVASVPPVDATRYGMNIDAYSPRTFNHEPIPGLLMYSLKDANQDCGISDVAVSDPAPLPGEMNAYMTSPNRWTSTGSGWTRCWVSV